MRALFSALGVSAVLCCGCSEIILDPLAAEPKDDVEVPNETVVPKTPNAIAIRVSQWLPTDAGGQASSFNESGILDNPDALILFFADRPQACEARPRPRRCRPRRRRQSAACRWR